RLHELITGKGKGFPIEGLDTRAGAEVGNAGKGVNCPNIISTSGVGSVHPALKLRPAAGSSQKTVEVCGRGGISTQPEARQHQKVVPIIKLPGLNVAEHLVVHVLGSYIIEGGRAREIEAVILIEAYPCGRGV